MAGEYDDAPRPRAKSGAVTAVAIVNFVLGGLALVCGLLGMLGGAIVGGVGKELAKDPKLPPEQAKAFQQVAEAGGGGLIMLMALIPVIWGVMAIVSGIGVIQRKAWGRILSLILGGIAVIMAVVGIVTGGINLQSLVSTVIYLGYAGFIFAILLNNDKAAEFS